MTLTEPTIMRRPGIERSELETPELALARGDHGSGRLIRSGDSNHLIHHRQDRLRVIRSVIDSFGAAQGLALRVCPGGGASVRSGGGSWLAETRRPSRVMAPGQDP
jgi:hypothetical protein